MAHIAPSRIYNFINLGKLHSRRQLSTYNKVCNAVNLSSLYAHAAKNPRGSWAYLEDGSVVVSPIRYLDHNTFETELKLMQDFLNDPRQRFKRTLDKFTDTRLLIITTRRPTNMDKSFFPIVARTFVAEQAVPDKLFDQILLQLDDFGSYAGSKLGHSFKQRMTPAFFKTTVQPALNTFRGTLINGVLQPNVRLSNALPISKNYQGGLTRQALRGLHKDQMDGTLPITTIENQVYQNLRPRMNVELFGRDMYPHEEIAARKARMREAGSDNMGMVLAREQEVAQREEEISRREDELTKREGGLNATKERLTREATKLAKSEEELTRRWKMFFVKKKIDQKEADLAARETQFAIEERFARREGALAVKEQELLWRETALKRKLGSLRWQMRGLGMDPDAEFPPGYVADSRVAEDNTVDQHEALQDAPLGSENSRGEKHEVFQTTPPESLSNIRARIRLPRKDDLLRESYPQSAGDPFPK
ncbi:hypothetical protein K469DRAFT_694795 [Zopfia rhizophila CBS 207.26]|uniref:Uncharacterized protein n=1 Tax=Zopfia rhizophila CBS 207.26 TaxID=1314779 RepID=A0A6A6EN96_9PEZI|nr:hypothetical protein K469DRAFT_694795 [Zopfia rhizophila CBS 207.26]